VCAVLAGVAAFLYTVAFVILQHDLLSGLFLMLTGLLSTAALVAVYERLSETEAIFALFVLLGIGGALGSAVHRGDNLSNGVNPRHSSRICQARSPPGVCSPSGWRVSPCSSSHGLLLAVGSSRRV
jgi:hypothetical protein